MDENETEQKNDALLLYSLLVFSILMSSIMLFLLYSSYVETKLSDETDVKTDIVSDELAEHTEAVDGTESDLDVEEQVSQKNSAAPNWTGVEVGDEINGMTVTDVTSQNDTNLTLQLTGEHVFTGSRVLTDFNFGMATSENKPILIYINDPDSFLHDSVIQIKTDDLEQRNKINNSEEFTLFSFTIDQATFANHLLPVQPYNHQFVHGYTELRNLKVVSFADIRVGEVRDSLFDQTSKIQVGDTVDNLKVTYVAPFDYSLSIQTNCNGSLCVPGQVRMDNNIRIKLKPIYPTILTGTLLPVELGMLGDLDLIEFDKLLDYPNTLSEKNFWVKHADGISSIRNTYGEGRKEFNLQTVDIHKFPMGMPSASLIISDIKNLE